MYIAPPLETQVGDYSATVTVEHKDTKVSDSETITVKVQVKPVAPELPTGQVVVNATGVSLWQRIEEFFATLFVSEVREVNVTKENVTRNVTQPQLRPTTPSTPNQTTVPATGQPTRNVTKAPTAEEKEKETAEMNITEKSFSEKLVDFFYSLFRTGNVSTGNVTNVSKEVKEVEERKENGVGKEVTTVPAPTRQVSNVTTAVNATNVTALSLPEFLVAYRTYLIVGIILAIIILIILSGFWKKIVDFFAEEEEKVEAEKAGEGKKIEKQVKKVKGVNEKVTRIRTRAQTSRRR